MKLKKEKRIPNPNRKTDKVTFRVSAQTLNELEIIRRAHPDLKDFPKVIRCCISTIAADVKRLLK